MANKKIYLVVTPFFPTPDSWRGAYVLDQVKAIIRNSDYKVRVFMGGNNTDSDYEIDGIKVYRYRTRELPSNFLNGFFNEYNAKSFVKKVLQIGINPQDVAFVHCHVSMRAACGIAMKKLNPSIKVLLQHHDLDPFNLRSGVLLRNNRFNVRYRAKKAIALYNKVDLHICISEACRDCLILFPEPRPIEEYEDCIRSLKLCEGLPRIKPKNTFVLYNGVDGRLFKPINVNSRLKDDNTFRIGCIANFSDLKDHMTLIRAFEKFVKNINLDSAMPAKGFRLSLLGTGETRAMCEKYIHEHGLDSYLEWPEEVTHDKLPKYYHSLNLFILPSYFEGFGCVYTEAYACGVPFMGVYHQGAAELIAPEEQNKWLIQPHDETKLAELIMNYYKYPSKQILIQSYDIDDLIKNYLSYLKNLQH